VKEAQGAGGTRPALTEPTGETHQGPLSLISIMEPAQKGGLHSSERAMGSRWPNCGKGRKSYP